jgi:Ca-activated chloride channel family protein
MKHAKTSIISGICLILLLPAAALWHGLTAAGDIPAALAQDESNPSSPPLKRRTPEKGAADQDVPQGRTSISVAVDLVSLQVLVKDPKGNTITGLKPENFTIYEDNVKQEITNFSPLESNITVVMLVEYSKFTTTRRSLHEEVWETMYTFIRSLRQGDWIATIAYDQKPTILCDFTQDISKAEASLRRLPINSLWRGNLCDALIDTLDRVQDIDGKVAIVLLSTGLDDISKHTYDEALNKCKESDATIYSVGLAQNLRLVLEASGMIAPEDNLDLLMADNRLLSFSDFTGGGAYFPRFSTELPAIFSNISQMLRSQYSIAYSSSNTVRDGKFRKIRVEVTSDKTDNKGKPVKLKASTRKGYLAKAS